MILALLVACRPAAGLECIVTPAVQPCMRAASHPHAYFAEVPVKRWRTSAANLPPTALDHPLRIHGETRDRAEIRRRVSAVLERVGLAPPEQYLGKYPSDLSGGQKQQAVLARAVILNPSLLVADEPVLPRGEIPDAARPPLGCRFHPRCPRAFEVCGWESRDLRDLLELRWAEAGEERFVAERGTLGDLELLDEPSTHARVPAAGGRSGADVAEMLGRVRADQPGEPFWKGVRSIEPAASEAAVGFHDPADPELRPVGGVRVACHLYSEEDS
jgi:hypothetical protein